MTRVREPESVDPRTDNPRPDLGSRAQVHDLVVEFYREIVFDELLEPVFGDVAEVDWTLHIPKLIDYWCWILLGEGVAGGSIMGPHRRVHQIEPIRAEHCDRWFTMWVACVRANWSGPVADHAVSHAEQLMVGMAKRVFGFEWSAPAVEP